jgi:hypothetical protein
MVRLPLLFGIITYLLIVIAMTVWLMNYHRHKRPPKTTNHPDTKPSDSDKTTDAVSIEPQCSGNPGPDLSSGSQTIPSTGLQPLINQSQGGDCPENNC